MTLLCVTSLHMSPAGGRETHLRLLFLPRALEAWGPPLKLCPGERPVAWGSPDPAARWIVAWDKPLPQCLPLKSGGILEGPR